MSDQPTIQPAPQDYRDQLRQILDLVHEERGLTRYRICKQMGIDSGTLSNVLAKRRHFSLEKLEEVLGIVGHDIVFVRRAPATAPTAVPAAATPAAPVGTSVPAERSTDL